MSIRYNYSIKQYIDRVVLTQSKQLYDKYLVTYLTQITRLDNKSI